MKSYTQQGKWGKFKGVCFIEKGVHQEVVHIYLVRVSFFTLTVIFQFIWLNMKVFTVSADLLLFFLPIYYMYIPLCALVSYVKVMLYLQQHTSSLFSFLLLLLFYGLFKRESRILTALVFYLRIRFSFGNKSGDNGAFLRLRQIHTFGGGTIGQGIKFYAQVMWYAFALYFTECVVRRRQFLLLTSAIYW